MTSPPGLLPVGLDCLIGERSVVIEAFYSITAGLLEDAKPPPGGLAGGPGPGPPDIFLTALSDTGTCGKAHPP